MFWVFRKVLLEIKRNGNIYGWATLQNYFDVLINEVEYFPFRIACKKSAKYMYSRYKHTAIV